MSALFARFGATRIAFLAAVVLAFYACTSWLWFFACVVAAHVGARELVDLVLASTIGRAFSRARAGAIVITGASRGMGAAAAVHLAHAGFRVFAGVRKAADGAALQRSLSRDAAGTIDVLVLDVCDDASVAAAAARVRDEISDANMPLVAVVNNAGTMRLGAVEGVSVATAQKVFDTNVFGVQRVVKAFAPLLRATAREWMNERGNGALRPRLVNVSSIAAFARAGHQAVYSSTKAALDVVTEALRQELEPSNVDVVLVSPYFVHSDMGAQWVSPAERASIVAEQRRERVDEVYGAATLSDTHLWSQVAQMTGISVDVFARLAEHVVTVNDADLRTQYWCGPPGLFVFPFLFQALPERLRAHLVQAVKPLVARVHAHWSQRAADAQ